MLAVVYKVWDEVLVHGNLSMVRQAETVRDQISQVKTRIDTHWKHDLLVQEFLNQLASEAMGVANQAAERRHYLLQTIREDL